MKELIHGRGVAVEEKQKGRGRARLEGRRAHGVIRVGCGPGMTDERLGYDGARAGKSLANKEVGSGHCGAALWSYFTSLSPHRVGKPNEVRFGTLSLKELSLHSK